LVFSVTRLPDPQQVILDAEFMVHDCTHGVKRTRDFSKKYYNGIDAAHRAINS
jgi:hypothetical protein